MVAKANFVRLPEGSSQLGECNEKGALQRWTTTVVELILIKSRKWASPHVLKFLLSLLSKSLLLSYFMVRQQIVSCYLAEQACLWKTPTPSQRSFHYTAVWLESMVSQCYWINYNIGIKWRGNKTINLRFSPLFYWFASGHSNFQCSEIPAVHYRRKQIFYIFVFHFHSVLQETGCPIHQISKWPFLVM